MQPIWVHSLCTTHALRYVCDACSKPRGPSTLRGRKTVQLKLRTYTGHDTRVLWAFRGEYTSLSIYLLEFNSHSPIKILSDRLAQT